jgi:CBS domain-containing protein
MRTVEEIMSTDVVTANVNDVVGSVRDVMLAKRVHAVPVLDDSGALVGLVTSADLVEEWSPQMGVRTVVNHDVMTAGIHTTVVDAARMMVERHVHHLVVMQRQEVVGIVSSFDVMRHLATRVEQLARPATPTSGLQAKPGDVLVVMPQHLGGKERRATVVAVHGEDGTGPFTVWWSDDPHDEPRRTLFFPSTDTYVESAPSV